MPFLTETSASVSVSASSSSCSTIAEHLKLRRPARNQINTTETDPDPVSEIPSLIQSTRSKSTISSLFLSSNNDTTKKKTNPFSQSALRGLGCTASTSQQVSVPAMIRTSADWETKKVKKKKKTQQQQQQQQQEQEKKKKKKKKKSSKLVVGYESNNSHKVHHHHHQQGVLLNEGSGYNISCGVIQDVWCGPGIGFSADAVGSVDRVATRRNVPARGKIDVEKVNHRGPSYIARRTVNSETLSFLDSDSAFISSRPEPDFFGSRYYRHARHPSPEGLAEIVMLQNNFLVGGRLDSRDRFSDWRLDIDSMSYEQLLELGEKIGHVNTGLKEDEISRCLRKMKGSVMNDLPVSVNMNVDRKCSICQEEYEANEEMGKLYCGHSFHIQCIKQWLVHKNTCPVCKTEATAQC
ncbi:hypothetical protein ERO13_A07G059400v2 [Gossypium hirsutum]|uniref:RING-type E3 ubiquitin transferase n=1 Tax=Gossypium hirsutum TaxID=3635 RepID=A0A1U8LEP3_GOSHI|nr:uncharacterized protein LOC107926704 isoform X1 [Gossypium hirsutum]KAG4190917.1 hypothetical protein ERO13_A07G059400v2 [Gossypium hirsutum]